MFQQNVKSRQIVNNDMVTDDSKENSTTDVDEVIEQHSVSLKHALAVKEVPEEDKDPDLLTSENCKCSKCTNNVEVLDKAVKNHLDNGREGVKENPSFKQMSQSLAIGK